jgi:hypothetical protein
MSTAPVAATNVAEETNILSHSDVSDLLTASRSGSGAERRTAERYPFFAPVSIMPYDETQQRWSAFSRDMSADGIGLLHNMPIDCGRICELSITQAGIHFRRRSELMWCTAAGEGWYLSGWRFVETTL